VPAAPACMGLRNYNTNPPNNAKHRRTRTGTHTRQPAPAPLHLHPHPPRATAPFRRTTRLKNSCPIRDPHLACKMQDVDRIYNHKPQAHAPTTLRCYGKAERKGRRRTHVHGDGGARPLWRLGLPLSSLVAILYMHRSTDMPYPYVAAVTVTTVTVIMPCAEAGGWLWLWARCAALNKV
jgi:hypothetical protein